MSVTDLGRAIRDRRGELALSQKDVERAGGPVDVTIRQLELGRAPTPRQGTLGALDRGLRWAPGTADAYLRGVEPPGAPSAEPVGASPVDEPAWRSLLGGGLGALTTRALLAQLREIVDELDRRAR